jgi:hypothetical protein
MAKSFFTRSGRLHLLAKGWVFSFVSVDLRAGNGSALRGLTVGVHRGAVGVAPVCPPSRSGINIRHRRGGTFVLNDEVSLVAISKADSSLEQVDDSISLNIPSLDCPD